MTVQSYRQAGLPQLWRAAAWSVDPRYAMARSEPSAQGRHLRAEPEGKWLCIASHPELPKHGPAMGP